MAEFDETDTDRRVRQPFLHEPGQIEAPLGPFLDSGAMGGDQEWSGHDLSSSEVGIQV